MIYEYIVTSLQSWSRCLLCRSHVNIRETARQFFMDWKEPWQRLWNMGLQSILHIHIIYIYGKIANRFRDFKTKYRFHQIYIAMDNNKGNLAFLVSFIIPTLQIIHIRDNRASIFSDWGIGNSIQLKLNHTSYNCVSLYVSDICAIVYVNLFRWNIYMYIYFFTSILTSGTRSSVHSNA